VPLSQTEKDTFDQMEERELQPVGARWRPWTDAIELLWSKRRRIGAWVIVGVLLSSFVAWKMPKYESVTQLMPPDSGSSALGAAFALPALTKSPGLASLASIAGDMAGLKSSGALFAKILTSRTLLDRLIERFDLRSVYGMKRNEDVRQKLLLRVTIEEDKKSGVIMISVKDHDPQRAAALAAAFTEELNHMMQTVATSSARRERVFLEQRLDEEKKTLADSQQQFSQFASKNMALDIPEQTKITVEAASRLQGELIANRAQLESLEAIYTPENYRVKSMRAHVNELERELSKLNTGKASVGTADPTSPYPSVKTLPVLGVQWSNLFRETKIHETVYELLTQQYELARIQEAKEMPAVKVLDPPSLPDTRVPSPFMIVFAGVVISAFLAMLGILLQYYLATWNSKDPRRLLLSRMYSALRRPGLRLDKSFRQR
jgi:capsule polysaccharide export protein KpsE/RkpR